MDLTRKLITLAIGLGLAFFLPTGSALAAAGDLTEAETNFAHEIATSSTDLTNKNQVYTMGVDRTTTQDFIVRYTLSIGEFGSTPAVPTVGGAGAATVTQEP